MKGVIVQVGKPKSIVLFNNGKIGTIPTPANCHVGMVVTVKLNNLLKIIIITLAAIFLVAAGVFIGLSLTAAPESPDTERYWQEGQGRGHRRGYMINPDRRR
jgi:hypothetical protein